MTLWTEFDAESWLSPDGRCKSFDARANGYVRSEGCASVVLRRLSDAKAAGDRIYALIRGSAINNDGASNGLLAPHPAAQTAVLRDAYRRAGVDPSAVSYVEAHGTGTALGDPIEANALGAVVGPGRDAMTRCRVGSVKTNLGHLEAAAGLASLIKVALCLWHRAWVATLHFEKPNPAIDFDALGLRVQTAFEPWSDGETSAYAGISSFGFGGSNAHVVLETAGRNPQEEAKARDKRDEGGRAQVVPISARCSQSLEGLARAYRDWISTSDASIADVAWTAGVHRSHHPHRIAVVAESKRDLAKQLDAFLEERARPRLASGHAREGGEPGPRGGVGGAVVHAAPAHRKAGHRHDVEGDQESFEQPRRDVMQRAH